jgi:ferrochelatase
VAAAPGLRTGHPGWQDAGVSLAPYDGILLLSFGGPEGPDDVLPFLRNVTRGRGVPDERLAAVAEHYHRFGGRSPINEQNRALRAALESELSARGLAVPLYWGNRNWPPLLADALRQARDAGVRRLITLVTSAYSSYSGCRQYREDLAAALTELAAEGPLPAVDKLRTYFNHPGFVAPVVTAARDGLAGLPEGAHVVFVTHSLPTAAAQASGPAGGAYVAQHLDLAMTVAVALGLPRERWDLAFCSRSGPPQQPWLEPDVNERLAALHAAGATGVLVVPIGFVSDHLEVVYDLDVEAWDTAERLGLPFARAATPGTDPRFVSGLVDLLLERAATERGQAPARPAVGALGPGHDLCPAGCCPNPQRPRPAACGADWTGVPSEGR